MFISTHIKTGAKRALAAAASAVMLSALAAAQLPADKAYAEPEPQKHYTLDAKLIDGDAMPGVYSVKAVDGDSIADGKTIGIPSVAKQTLADSPTKEMPAIIMGAAVNYERRTGPVNFVPFEEGTERIAPYSYFRYGVMDEQLQNEDGTVTTHKKLSGFDGTYYIIRVDVSNLIEGHGDGEYLHVKQESNKALMVAMGMEGTTFSDALGNKTGSYSLADNAKALKDSGANDTDKDTPYFDVIVMSSGKLAAGADAGKQDAPSADIKLSFYVDDQVQYNDLQMLDTANKPTFPYTVGGVTYQAETDYNKALLAKFYDDTKAAAAESAASYTVMDSDLEIDVAVNANNGEQPEKRPEGITWIKEDHDFWSMDKAVSYMPYDDHTITLICEVPMLTGLEIAGTSEKIRYVIIDVNSFDIQIANNTEKEKAGLTINSSAALRLMDTSNTSGAELAIGNNATMLVKSGGLMYVDSSCTLEVEYDAATTVDPAQVDTSVANGAITVEENAFLFNFGVINIEGTEGKPQQPSTQEQEQGQQVYYDKKSADLIIQKGGTLSNFGCISLKGVLYMLGTLENYGRYNDTIVAYDPDKGSTAYHRGIQVTWKDIVTDPGVVPGRFAVGIDADNNVVEGAVVNNYGDIVLVPGTLDLNGTLSNLSGSDSPLADDEDTGKLYMCTANEAIIPITPTPEAPLVVEKRITLDPPKRSEFNNKGTFNGSILKAKVELIHNGVLGELTLLDPAAVTTAPAANTLTYNGSEQALVTEGTAENGTMQYAIGDDKGALADFADAIPTAADAGLYYVWYKAAGDLDHNDSKPVCVEVTVAAAPSAVTAAPEQNELEYTGDAQLLVTPGATDFGTMQYALGSDVEPLEEFTGDIPEGTDAGTYYVWYRASGDLNHNETEPEVVAVTIEKVVPVLKTAPEARVLTADGTAQALVTEGEAEGGTILFAYGDENEPLEEFSNVIPTGTEPGTYYVWYFVEGDSDHFDSTPYCLKVEIAAAQPADSSEPEDSSTPEDGSKPDESTKPADNSSNPKTGAVAGIGIAAFVVIAAAAAVRRKER